MGNVYKNKTKQKINPLKIRSAGSDEQRSGKWGLLTLGARAERCLSKAFRRALLCFPFFHLILSLTGSLQMECKESVQPGLSGQFMSLNMMSPTLAGVIRTHCFILSFPHRFSCDNESPACRRSLACFTLPKILKLTLCDVTKVIMFCSCRTLAVG